MPIALVGALAPYLAGGDWLTFMREQMLSIVAGIAALTVLLVRCVLRANRYSVAALVAVALLMVRLYPNEDGKVETVRSFFGVHKIVTNADGAYRVLMHGTTIHGAQKLLNADGTPVQGRPEMITYYSDGRRHRRRDRGDPRAQGCRPARRGDRPRRRHADLPAARGRDVEVLRDRPVDDRYRERPEIFHLHPRLLSGHQAGAGRRAAHLRQGAGRRLRPDRGRRLFVRRDPDSSGDARGDGDLQAEARARRAWC